jgi:hypothetical protein
MVEEKVARTRRTNERIVIDVEEAPEDAAVHDAFINEGGTPNEIVVHSPDLAVAVPVAVPEQVVPLYCSTDVVPAEHVKRELVESL